MKSLNGFCVFMYERIFSTASRDFMKESGTGAITVQSRGFRRSIYSQSLGNPLGAVFRRLLPTSLQHSLNTGAFIISRYSSMLSQIDCLISFSNGAGGHQHPPPTKELPGSRWMYYPQRSHEVMPPGPMNIPKSVWYGVRSGEKRVSRYILQVQSDGVSLAASGFIVAVAFKSCCVKASTVAFTLRYLSLFALNHSRLLFFYSSFRKLYISFILN